MASCIVLVLSDKLVLSKQLPFESCARQSSLSTESAALDSTSCSIFLSVTFLSSYLSVQIECRREAAVLYCNLFCWCYFIGACQMCYICEFSMQTCATHASVRAMCNYPQVIGHASAGAFALPGRYALSGALSAAAISQDAQKRQYVKRHQASRHASGLPSAAVATPDLLYNCGEDGIYQSLTRFSPNDSCSSSERVCPCGSDQPSTCCPMCTYVYHSVQFLLLHAACCHLSRNELVACCMSCMRLYIAVDGICNHINLLQSDILCLMSAHAHASKNLDVSCMQVRVTTASQLCSMFLTVRPG